MKNEVIEKMVECPILLNKISKTHKKGINPKYEPLASYFDFCESSRTNSQFQKIFKSQNCAQFLRFGPDFLHVINILSIVYYLFY